MTKWDARYRDSISPGEPCWVLRNNSHLLPESGRSLDLACGLGANALLLAELGLTSHAWDSSLIALEKLQHFAATRQLTVHTLQQDVEINPPGKESFEVIVVSQFLFRPILPALINALSPGGLLFYQTFNQNKQSDSGPNNPDYLLAPGELLEHFSDLKLVFYREDAAIGKVDRGLRDLSYFVGQKPQR